MVRVSRLSFRFLWLWLRWFYKTRLTCKRLFSCQIWQKKDNEMIFQSFEVCNFDRGIKIILRELFQTGTILCEKLIHMFIYCFIDKNPHISLYIVFSSKWIVKEAPPKRKADAFCYYYYYYYYYHYYYYHYHYHYYHFYYYYYYNHQFNVVINCTIKIIYKRNSSFRKNKANRCQLKYLKKNRLRIFKKSSSP